MLVHRRRGDQDDARVLSHDFWVSDDLLQIGLVLLQGDVLLVRSIWKGSIVGAEEDGLSRSVGASVRSDFLVVPGNEFWPPLAMG